MIPNFFKTYGLVIAITLLVIAALMYFDPFVLTRGKATEIISDFNSPIRMDTGYLQARARSIKTKKDTFKYKGSTYNTATGKKM